MIHTTIDISKVSPLSYYNIAKDCSRFSRHKADLVGLIADSSCEHIHNTGIHRKKKEGEIVSNVREFHPFSVETEYHWLYIYG